jgi:hypothetical protein
MMINDQVLCVFPGQWRVAYDNRVDPEVFDTEDEAKMHLALLCKGRCRRSRRSQNNSRVFQSLSLN